MDMKSMAKSKRSHTQHNNPRKPNIHPKKPTKNPSNLTPNNPKVVPFKPSLPSNWDRYDDDDDDAEFEVEKPGEPVSKEAGKMAVSEEVKVKSKGADFGYLVAQAKESRERFSVSPSFGDNVDDFYQGLAPMLEVKSESIPSWFRDDDFLLENEATTSDEGPNFSLDLMALAEDLAKLDLAKRLFIEPDLLPPELRGVDDDNKVPEKRKQTFETFAELYSLYLADEKIAEAEDANKAGIISSDDQSTSKFRDMPQTSQATEQNAESKLHDIGHEVNNVAGHNSMSQPEASISNLKSTAATHHAPFPHSWDVSRPAQITSSLDDELDDLLDASNLNKKSSLFQSIEVKDGSTDYGVTLGAPLRNFQDDPSRSAFPIIPGSLDDELDNLLEETSKPTLVKIDSAVFPSPSSSSTIDPGLNPKAMDDFDSWMDSL
ncbi:hypothetical protein vseg_018252 [Gypsophila vaccaria]